MATRGSIESKAAARRYSSDSSSYNTPSIAGGHNEEPQSPFQVLNRTRKISIICAILVAIAIIVLLEWACRCLPALPAQQFLSDMSKRDIPTAAGPRTQFLYKRNLTATDESSTTSSPSADTSSGTSTEAQPPPSTLTTPTTINWTLPHVSYADVTSTTSTSTTTEAQPPSSTLTTTTTMSLTPPHVSYADVTSTTSTSTSTTRTSKTSSSQTTTTPTFKATSYAHVTDHIPPTRVHPGLTVEPPKAGSPATVTLTLVLNSPKPSARVGESSIWASDHKLTPYETQSKISSPTDILQSGQKGSSDNGTSDNGTSDNGTSDNGTSDNGTSDNGISDNGTSDNSASKKSSSGKIDTSNGPHSDSAKSSLDHGSTPTTDYPMQNAHLKSANSASTGTVPPRVTPSRYSGNSVPGDSGAKAKSGQAEPPATTAAADSLPQWQSTGRASQSVITYKFTTMTIATGNPTSTPFATATEKAPSTILSYETYLVGAWVPTFVALLFAIPWLILDTFFRTIEPYRQLASDQGATAADSLCLNYVNSWLFITPFRAVSNRHWPVFLSSTLSCIAILLMALAPEAVYIHVSGPCTQGTPSGCYPSLVIFQPIARTIQTILGIMIVLALALVVTVYAQSIPVSFDPRSIAATTILSNNEVVLSRVRGLDPGMSRTEHLQRLGDFKYKLGPYENEHGTSCIGIYGFSPQQSRALPSNEESKTRCSTDYQEPSQIEESSRKRHHLLYRIAIVGTVLIVTALFIMLVYYYKLDYENGYERFMDSQTLGVRLFFVSMGVLLKLAWRYFHQDYNQMLPYHRLAAGYAPLESTILRTPSYSTVGAMFASIKYKQPFAAFLALVTVLANILPLTLPNIPFSRVTPLIAYKISTYCSIGVFSLMLIASASLFFSPRSRLLPRDPGTIATVLLFVCNSQMLDLFADLQHANQKTRDATMKRAEFSYGLGMLTCDDGQKRLGIDIDPFIEYTT